MLLNREQMLAKVDAVPTGTVDVPEWGDGAQVKVKALGTAGRLQWIVARNKILDGEEAPDPTALLVTLAAVDDDGKLLFSIQDTDWLSQADGDVVERIADKVAKMSGLIDDADKDAEGNSDATQSGDSPSASPETSDARSPN